jgi:hypothetical protein
LSANLAAFTYAISPTTNFSIFPPHPVLFS